MVHQTIKRPDRVPAGTISDTWKCDANDRRTLMGITVRQAGVVIETFPRLPHLRDCPSSRHDSRSSRTQGVARIMGRAADHVGGVEWSGGGEEQGIPGARAGSERAANRTPRGDSRSRCHSASASTRDACYARRTCANACANNTGDSPRNCHLSRRAPAKT
jgi:hypothetical protein